MQKGYLSRAEQLRNTTIDIYEGVPVLHYWVAIWPTLATTILIENVFLNLWSTTSQFEVFRVNAAKAWKKIKISKLKTRIYLLAKTCPDFLRVFIGVDNNNPFGFNCFGPTYQLIKLDI